jgi:hypothetical protein
MRHARSIAAVALVFACTAFTLAHLLKQQAMLTPKHTIPFFLLPASFASVDINWYPPKKTWINDLSQVVNGSGTHGFIFNSSVLPAGTPYGTYNWCT